MSGTIEPDYSIVDDYIAAHRNKINQKFRLGYHIMGEVGWINDPNGLVYYNGTYHVFFQYHPFCAHVGPTCWGHVISKDLVHWSHCPIALSPVNSYDQDGCFSGSAIVKDNMLCLVYSGHKKIGSSYQEYQNIAFSSDGQRFVKYPTNPIIVSAPPCSTKRFRDPKIWYENPIWKMVIGSENQHHEGQALLYKSRNLVDWDFEGILAHTGNKNGYMWECPDYFSLEGENILLISKKVKAGKDKEIYETGVLVKKLNSFSASSFQVVDIGYDFYAAQTFQNKHGKRILIAWMGMPNKNIPEQQDGWAGALTIPRELFFNSSGKVCMKPIEELKALRKECMHSSMQIYPNQSRQLATGSQFEIKIILTQCQGSINAFNFTIKSPIDLVEMNYSNRIITFKKYGCTEVKRAHLNLNNEVELHLYIDTSSVELFINDGEVSFTSRIYSENGFNLDLMSLSQVLNVDQTVWKLDKCWR